MINDTQQELCNTWSEEWAQLSNQGYVNHSEEWSNKRSGILLTGRKLLQYRWGVSPFHRNNLSFIQSEGEQHPSPKLGNRIPRNIHRFRTAPAPDEQEQRMVQEWFKDICDSGYTAFLWRDVERLVPVLQKLQSNMGFNAMNRQNPTTLLH